MVTGRFFLPQKSVKKSSQKYTVSIEKFFKENSLVRTKITSKLRLFFEIKKLILSYFCNLCRWLKNINLQLHDIILSIIVYNASAAVPLYIKRRLSLVCHVFVYMSDICTYVLILWYGKFFTNQSPSISIAYRPDRLYCIFRIHRHCLFN